LSDFTKLGVGEGVSGPPPSAKFHYRGFRTYVHRNRQNMEFFGYKSAPKGPIP